MTALRHFKAFSILLIGVAPGLVEGVIAATTPTGRAYSDMPVVGLCEINPTVFALLKSRTRPRVLR